MNTGTGQRKLAALIPLCGTDMAGYSALDQRNEALAHNSRPGEQPRLHRSAGA